MTHLIKGAAMTHLVETTRELTSAEEESVAGGFLNIYNHDSNQGIQFQSALNLFTNHDSNQGIQAGAVGNLGSFTFPTSP